MSVLTIENFSCLKAVEFEVAPVTVLIGPQGSGKSLIAKLNYFFCDLFKRYLDLATAGLSTEQFQDEMEPRFIDWFPPATWDNSHFNLEFCAGDFAVRLVRRRSDRSVVEFSLSDDFASHYSEVRQLLNPRIPLNATSDIGVISYFVHEIELIRDKAQQILSKGLGNSFIHYQTFIPSGRAFLTSMGQGVSAFGRDIPCDPISLECVNLFARVRVLAGMALVNLRSSRHGGTVTGMSADVLDQLFGGQIKFDGSLELVEHDDGRQIPFWLLSSWQQELLPVFLFTRLPFAQGPAGEKPGRSWFYIEEPEAHLFPAAQSLLMDYLVSELSLLHGRTSMILTTHSPYILSKLSVYLKAIAVARHDSMSSRVAAIVPRACWLPLTSVTAYAIENGGLKSLIGEDGLVDGHYIDSVSEDIGRVFSQLLEIEYQEAAE